MGPQSLRLGERLHRRTIRRKSLRRIRNDTRTLLEVIDAKRVREDRGTTGRKRVVWPGDIVSQRLRRPGPHEYRTRILDATEEVERLRTVKLQVFRRNQVHRVDRRAEAVGADDKAVLERGARDLLAWALTCQDVNGRLDLLRKRGCVGNQVARGKRVVLRLCHEVRRHDGGIRRRIREHADLRRPCDHVDSHVAGDVALRRRDVGVSGPHNLCDLRDRLRSIGNRAYRLRAAYGIHLVDAGDCRRRERVRRKRTVPLGRGYHDHALDARDLCRHGIHEHRGRILRAAAGNVHRDGGNRRHLYAEDGAVLPRREPRLLALTLVEVANLTIGAPEGLEELGVDHVERAFNDLVGDAEALGAGTIELQAEVADRSVLPLPDCVHNLLGGVHDLLWQCALTHEIFLLKSLLTGKRYVPHGILLTGFPRRPGQVLPRGRGCECHSDMPPAPRRTARCSS